MKPETPGASLESVCDFVRTSVRSGKLEVDVCHFVRASTLMSVILYVQVPFHAHFRGVKQGGRL